MFLLLLLLYNILPNDCIKPIEMEISDSVIIFPVVQNIVACHGSGVSSQTTNPGRTRQPNPLARYIFMQQDHINMNIKW